MRYQPDRSLPTAPWTTLIRSAGKPLPIAIFDTDRVPTTTAPRLRGNDAGIHRVLSACSPSDTETVATPKN